MGEYSRTEFVEGMEELNCDSMAKLKRKLPQLRSELRDPKSMKVRLATVFLRRLVMSSSSGQCPVPTCSTDCTKAQGGSQYRIWPCLLLTKRDAQCHLQLHVSENLLGLLPHLLPSMTLPSGRPELPYASKLHANSCCTALHASTGFVHQHTCIF